MKMIIARYNIGIWTSPNKGNARSESYAPRKIIGNAASASPIGLNHPPIAFLSSIYPITNARKVVIITAKISFICKNA